VGEEAAAVVALSPRVGTSGGGRWTAERSASAGDKIAAVRPLAGVLTVLTEHAARRFVLSLPQMGVLGKPAAITCGWRRMACWTV